MIKMVLAWCIYILDRGMLLIKFKGLSSSDGAQSLIFNLLFVITANLISAY